MNTKLRYIALFFAITLALALCIPSFGQVVKGSISGSVIDPQGAVVSGAHGKSEERWNRDCIQLPQLIMPVCTG